jgi:membrane glycosyltransferase
MSDPMARDVRETGEPVARPHSQPDPAAIAHKRVVAYLRQLGHGDAAEREALAAESVGRARLRARRPDELGRRAIEEARRRQDGWLTRVFGLPKNASPQELGRARAALLAEAGEGRGATDASEALWSARERSYAQATPQEAPMEVPEQDLGIGSGSGRWGGPGTGPGAAGASRPVLRRALYFMLVGMTTLMAVGLLTSVFQKDGMTPLELLLLVLYTLLIVWISAAFWTAGIGFAVLLRGGDPKSIDAAERKATPPSEWDPGLRTALVMPAYNEDPMRVFAGIRAMYEGLRETGRLQNFEFFVLSDTRDPDTWVEEEVLWYQTTRDLNAHGRIFYRNREDNTAKKAGNIAEFVRRWGGRYRYMVVLDADSLMEAETVIRMAGLMEANERVALVQSPPLPIHRESLFARILQFAASLYGSMFSHGLCFWQMADGNSWGHNAIIRVSAFARHCGLPRLPGREPLGGQVMSHDFIEAALLRRAGYELWLAPDLSGSFEELPPTLIDYAKRDRRWCQGNLQHLRLLFARGFKAMSRLHLVMGLMSYLSSPLWCLFLLITGVEAYVHAQTEPVYFFGDNLFPVWPESYAVEMTTVMVVTLTMLFLPKLFGLLLAWGRPALTRAYGGYTRLGVGVLLETLFSSLTAPILMLYQSKFVLAILLRRSIGWPAQQRGDHALGLRDAARAHGGQTCLGIVAGVVSFLWIPELFWWLTPVLAGLWLSIPLSMYSSRVAVGRWALERGLFLTPVEKHPPAVSARVLRHIGALAPATGTDRPGIKRVLIEPAVNALHMALLPERRLGKRQRYHLRMLIYQLLEEGPESLTQGEKRWLISDPETLCLLHTLTWSEEPMDAETETPVFAAA